MELFGFISFCIGAFLFTLCGIYAVVEDYKEAKRLRRIIDEIRERERGIIVGVPTTTPWIGNATQGTIVEAATSA